MPGKKISARRPPPLPSKKDNKIKKPDTFFGDILFLSLEKGTCSQETVLHGKEHFWSGGEDLFPTHIIDMATYRYVRSETF